MEDLFCPLSALSSRGGSQREGAINLASQCPQRVLQNTAHVRKSSLDSLCCMETAQVRFSPSRCRDDPWVADSFHNVNAVRQVCLWCSRFAHIHVKGLISFASSFMAVHRFHPLRQSWNCDGQELFRNSGCECSSLRGYVCMWWWWCGQDTNDEVFFHPAADMHRIGVAEHLGV